MLLREQYTSTMYQKYTRNSICPQSFFNTILLVIRELFLKLFLSSGKANFHKINVIKKLNKIMVLGMKNNEQSTISSSLCFLFAPACCDASVFGAQRQIESDLCISRRYAMLILNYVFVLRAGVFAAQGPAKSDFVISKGCVRVCVRCSVHVLGGFCFSGDRFRRTKAQRERFFTFQ